MIAWQITRLVMTAAVLFGLSSFTARSAYLDEGDTPSGRPERILRRPIPIPPRDRDNPLRQILRRVDLGRPCTYGRLTVFPLVLGDTGDQPDIRTLDEALNRGWITIREQEQARVAEVVVRNESRYPVFMMGGEILGGGHQDRIIRNDVLIGRGRAAVTVPVYCVEQDRWKGTRESFDRAPYLAGQSMRGLAARAASQEAIWTEVDQRLKQSGTPAPTRSYQALYNDRDMGRRIDQAANRFHSIRTRRTVGLVITDRGRVVSGDLFADPEICERLWDKIIRSHVADIVIHDDWRRDGEKTDEGFSESVRDFLRAMLWAELERESTPGDGESFALRGQVDGRALLWNGGLIHAVAFPAPMLY
jgi:hypothetical protein